MSGRSGEIKSRSNVREVELAKAYKFCVKRIMDCVDVRIGGDNVIREAVMVELQVFYHTAKKLMSDIEPHVLEEFHTKMSELVCQYESTSRT